MYLISHLVKKNLLKTKKLNFLLQNGYPARRRSLVDDARFETLVVKQTKQTVLDEARLRANGKSSIFSGTSPVYFFVLFMHDCCTFFLLFSQILAQILTLKTRNTTNHPKNKTKMVSPNAMARTKTLARVLFAVIHQSIFTIHFTQCFLRP